MAPQWHYTHNGKKHGPVSSDELRRLAAGGGLLPTDTLWKDGMPQWVPAKMVKGLFAAATPQNTVAPPPPPPVVVTASPSKPRTSASGTATQPINILLGIAVCVLAAGVLAYNFLSGPGLPSVLSVGGNIEKVLSPDEIVALRNAGWDPNAEGKYKDISFKPAKAGRPAAGGITAERDRCNFKLYKPGKDGRICYKELRFREAKIVEWLSVGDESSNKSFNVDESGNQSLQAETFFLNNPSGPTMRIVRYTRGRKAEESEYVGKDEVKKTTYFESGAISCREGEKTTEYFPGGKPKLICYGEIDVDDPDPRNRYWNKDGEEIDAEQWRVNELGPDWRAKRREADQRRIQRNADELRRNLGK